MAPEKVFPSFDFASRALWCVFQCLDAWWVWCCHKQGPDTARNIPSCAAASHTWWEASCRRTTSRIQSLPPPPWQGSALSSHAPWEHSCPWTPLQSKPGGVVVDSLDNLEVAKVDKLDKSLAGSLKLDLPYSGSVAVAILWPESQIRYFAIVWRDSFTVLLNTLQYIASPQLANQLWPDHRQ